MTIKTQYRITYQLGSTGSNHRTFSAALKALDRARRVARRNGDRQRITIKAAEYRDGRYYGEGSLSDDQMTQLAAL